MKLEENLEKLPSGSYRLRKQINRKMVRITFDHYPTEKEMLLALGAYLDGTPAPKELLIFANAAKQYVESKRNVLSPKTRKEYLETPARLSDTFSTMNIYEISDVDIQLEINRLAGKRSAKTVKNYHSFITSVIKFFRPDFSCNTTLPQVKITEPYIPDDKEVKKLLKYIKENRPDYYACVLLAAYGLRREEILAITADDLDGNILHITKGKVINENKEWVIKEPKTPKSQRYIEIPKDVADMIRNNGYAINKYPSAIGKVISKACKELKINPFSLHKLRHYFASTLMSKKVDVLTVASLGGWSSPDMIYKRYGHAMEDKKKKALTHINKILQ